MTATPAWPTCWPGTSPPPRERRPGWAGPCRYGQRLHLEDVSAGDPATDLAVLAVTDEDLLPAVQDGYAQTGAQAAAFDELIPFYVLLRRLAAAEWERRHGSTARTSRLLEQVASTRIPA